MTNRLGDLKWPAIGLQPVVIVPLGSTEQHGPHLPFNTDAVIAEAVAKALAIEVERLRDVPVLVAPVISYGSSGEHQSFPGTASIGNEALALTLVELVRSMSTWSRQVIVVNGHGGNSPTLKRVGEQLTAEGHDFRWVPCGVAGADAHAGHTETSLMLHLAPWSVARIAIRPGNTAPLRELLPTMVESGVAAVSPSGVLGDPTTASAGAGELIFAEMVARARAALLTGSRA